ncbi:hypothetical protein QIH77_02135 [Bradyrhizobium diazoefficiens]|uniref:hypothetical protein n=1 Tax=Bradyrhizobium diazoefficiens TaxID=1355477 RepID=UPI002729CE0D|nr:hypothetical protein [Bradyrhizobium diazoefficiens]WLA74058.1 hypothetical protein QIH77_02135 [Bradyrhizobium diazoefficiens]
MTVPGPVPAKVPAKKRARGARAGGSRPPRHLTGDPSGWRFQLRLSPQFFKNGIAGGSRLAGAAPMVRAQLGPRSRGEAQRLALQLASLCQTVCSFAADVWKGISMDASQTDDRQNELVQHTVTACQNAIARALENPAQAIGLARGLEAALNTLQLVRREVEKGEAGIAAVTSNAEALTRSALTDVLKLSSVPEALAALAAVEQVAPSFGPMPAPATPAPPATPNATPGLPLFSAISQAYIDMRNDRDRNHPDIPSLILRRQVFLDVVGDRTPDQYFPSDLQNFVNRMQYWPANVTKRSDMQGRSTLEILEANKNFELQPMAENTMMKGYVANIRTMMRHRIQDLNYRDPFASAQISLPKAYKAPKPREGISAEVTNRVFENGVKSRLLDEALLPPLAKLTSRRLGLLTYLHSADIRQKHGVWIAQTDGIVEIIDEETGKKTWRRVPIKTSESMTFYVLHNFLDEIGLVAWMRAQNGFIFKEAHRHPDPSKYMSKVMQNHMKRCGAKGGEVFHSLRGDAIDEMRDADVEGRARRLQSGHELGDVHDQYGFRALTAKQCHYLANLPLQEGINWDVFRGLDFDAMARRRRTRGRRPKLSEG